MLAVMLLIVTFILWPYQPFLGALALWGAASAAKSWTGEGLDVIELVVFYGALAGCLVVWFG